MKRLIKIQFYILLLIATLSSFSQVDPNENHPIKNLDLPMAEWTRAGVVLVHTPGFELFDGVIHPSAGLFEDYFDLEAAKLEHKDYIKKMEDNGITVYNVVDVLKAVDINKLRAQASKAFKYDTSNIDDDPLAIEAYRQSILNKMTRNDLINCLLLQPTVILHKTPYNTGYSAVYVHNPVTNLYFTRDQSISTPKGHIISRMNSTQRAVETEIIKMCYEQLGLKVIHEVSGDNTFLEGGDYIPFGSLSFIGCGMRTNQRAIDQLMNADAFGHDTVVVCRDRKFWQMQMHLDTYFNVIDKDLVTMAKSRLNAKKSDPEYVTVDVYSRAPGTKDYQLSERDIWFVDFLKRRNISIIGISEEDELHYANNFLCVAPRHIIAVGGQSETLKNTFREHNVKVEWLNLENLIDGYGAAHCMTQVLKREKP